MKFRPLATSMVAVMFCAATCAVAQSPSPEPGVDTSLPRPAAAAAAPASTARPAGPAAPTPVRPAPTAAEAAVPRRPANRVMDRLDLEASQITGNRELPRVLYIVPWRAPSSGELEGRPVNSLLYELTKPVDRDVFRRENRYFDALAATSAAGGAGSDPAPDGAAVRDTSQPRSPSGN